MPSSAPETETPVALSLGSNVGDARANLAAALARLTAEGAIAIDAVSPIFRTTPWGDVPQADFANLCATGLTRLAPRALLAATQAVERALGRQPGPRWGPRLIDIDIILFGDLTLDTPELTIPHRDAARRAFVMVPLAAIAAEFRLGGRRVGTIAAELDGAGVSIWGSDPTK